MCYWPCCNFSTIFFTGPFTFSWITWSHSGSMSVESRNPREACCSKLKVGLFLPLPFRLITCCISVMFGPSYLNPRLSTIVPCCKHAVFVIIFLDSTHHGTFYLHIICLPWQLTWASCKRQSMNDKKSRFALGKINFVTLTLSWFWSTTLFRSWVLRKEFYSACWPVVKAGGCSGTSAKLSVFFNQ